MRGMGGGVVVTRVSTRMAPAPAGGKISRSIRTTFAVGRLTRRQTEIRLVERTRAETVH